MYSLLRERSQFKDLALQALLIAIAGFATERIVEVFVEENKLLPESFALESIIFLTIWFGLDLLTCSILRSRSFLQSLTNQRIAKRSLISLAISWVIVVVFVRFYSFGLELALMLGLWLLLDFFISTDRKTH